VPVETPPVEAPLVETRPGEAPTPRRILSSRRLLVALLAALLVPGALVVAAVAYDRPEPPPTTSALRHPSLPQVPDSVAQAQLDRSAAATRIARRLGAPQLIPARGPGELPTLALAPRATSTLAELRGLVPAAFAEIPGAGGALLLDASIEVPVGAALVVDGQTPDVRLRSGTSGFATIVSRGTTTVAGSAQTPVTISTWDPQLRSADRTSTDGRSFVLQIGGRMDVDRGRFSHLGFGTGTSSGVAWRGAAPDVAGAPADAERIPARGTVTNSEFTHNHFGAYTHEARDMRWTGNTFADNEEYGFDPHDFSSGFVVEANTAHHNGKHGFIFSRGCDGNVLRGNTAYANAGHGFMIDDGRSIASAAAEARIDPSDGNVVTGNAAHDNAGSGVEIEGGTGNVVSANHLTRNDVGVRLKDGAAATITDNWINDSARYGVHVLDPASRGSITGNQISGSWAAVNLAAAESATLGENTSTDVSTPLVVADVAQRDPSWLDRVGRFLRWNPVLVLWGLILGVPLTHAALRVVRTPLRRRRRTT
jgi:parallel beta-helix repeat protein